MKSFIKDRLNLMLEGLRNVTQADFNRLTAKVANDVRNYSDDQYMQDAYEGDGIYEVKLWPNGNFEVRQTKRASEVGTFNTVNNKRYFYVKAYRGIEHPEFADTPRKGRVYGKSPADDAATKTRVIFAKDIIEFVKANMEGENAYTSDERGGEISKEKTADEWKYKFDREEKRKARQANKPQIKGDEDENAEFLRKQAELQAKRDKMKLRRGLKENLKELLWKKLNN